MAEREACTTLEFPVGRVGDLTMLMQEVDRAICVWKRVKALLLMWSTLKHYM